MRKSVALFAATVVALAPTAAFSAGNGPPASQSISPAHTTGQQNLECEDGGIAPGNPDRDLGPGSPFQEDSVSGSHYAGEQVGINDKNTASSSQYDIACFRPQH
jgi:hypothetical protein